MKTDTNSKGKGAIPTKQHSMKCPKLYGKKCTCDGYHTFDELYEHRIVLWIALCRQRHTRRTEDAPFGNVWCSVQHSDGSTFGDWFILGIGKAKGSQITYHLPARYWNEVCEFAEVLEKAPEFDGHDSDEVLRRLSIL